MLGAGSLTCTRIVRNNRTGKYAEVDLNPERPPVDEGDLGRSYTVARGEEVSANHEAVLDAPGAFESVDDSREVRNLRVRDSMPDRDPRLPGDSEDDRGNRERNQRIASIEAEGNNYGTEDDTEADERIYAGMVAVCDESGAVELPPCSGSHPGSDHVATKADQARQSERNQMTWPFGVDEALHGFVGSDAGRHEDRHDDRETCVPFGSIRAQHERDPQRNRRQRITEVVYQGPREGRRCRSGQRSGLGCLRQDPGQRGKSLPPASRRETV